MVNDTANNEAEHGDILNKQKLKEGNFQIKAKTYFKKKDSDYLFLGLEMSQDLQDLLNNNVIVKSEDLSNIEIHNGEQYLTFQRYKVKRFIYSELYGSYKDILFIKSFIDTGKIEFKILKAEITERIKLELLNNIKRIIEIILRYVDVTASLIVEVKR